MKEPSILTIPDPKLLEVTGKVTSFDNELQSTVELMRGLLKKYNGAGLAANQIGLQKSLLVLEVDEKDTHIPFQAFINPEIVAYDEDQDSVEEGCLSIPQIELPVERAKKIKLKFQDPSGRRRKLTAKGTLARILQHEIDHLNGVVFTDRVRDQFLAQYPQFKTLKVAFFGSGPLAATILKSLILLGLKLDIYTETAKPAGRGQTLKDTPVKTLAEKFGKKVAEIDTFSNFVLRISDFDLLICADFGKILPDNILKSAKISAINIHPSLLPKYRGPTPVQTAILKGEKKTGVTIIEMSPKVDEGGIFSQAEIEIEKQDTTQTLTDRLGVLAVKLLYNTLPLLVENKLEPITQDDKKATFTTKFTKDQGEIKWQKPLSQIERQIRAFEPWPGSFTLLPDGKRLIIHQAHLDKDALVLDIVQPEGKNPMSWQEFLRGYRGPKAEWFDKIK